MLVVSWCCGFLKKIHTTVLRSEVYGVCSYFGVVLTTDKWLASEERTNGSKALVTWTHCMLSVMGIRAIATELMILP